MENPKFGHLYFPLDDILKMAPRDAIYHTIVTVDIKICFKNTYCS